MSQLSLDDAHTLTGRDHPGTSHLAAASVLPKSGTKRREVLEALLHAPFGLTDYEVQYVLGMGANTERPRRVELVDMGLVENSGETRRFDGSEHIVWRATEKARRLT